jgi:aminoglycoside phosphotransferase (APT) family kinase protein
MIPIGERIPIHKGWSADKKYRITDESGKAYLLRVSPLAQEARKRTQFERMRQVAALGVPMCAPVEFGVSEEGAYSIQSWVDGADAEEVVPTLPEAEQYALGLRAGEILKMIHGIPAPKDTEPWESRMDRKIDQKIADYAACPLKFEGAEAMLSYIAANRHLMAGRPQTYQHGDYHIGNMMLSGGALVIIDFDRDDWGDPWEEFNRIVWCAQAAPLFATGMVDGYFDGAPPDLFWRLLALYISSNALSSLPWAIPFGQSEIDVMLRQFRELMGWYDGMTRTVPRWYAADTRLQWIDGVPFRLKAPFDFGFLSKYGRVFQVYDDQDSGNICFGVEKGGEKFFVKFAGAPTARFDGEAMDAVARLKATDEIYRALAHGHLVRLIASEEIGGGFAMVFKWAEGDCMGKQYPASRARFLALPLADKLRVYRDVLAFHAFVAEKGWVAIDFYDGSVLYDAARKRTTICDIDFYAKSPRINDMGRMWGSARFMSPEEFQLGAAIDEVSNVFTLGAMALQLFSGGDKSPEAWPLSPEALKAVLRATSPARAKRQKTIRQLMAEWEAGL